MLARYDGLVKAQCRSGVVMACSGKLQHRTSEGQVNVGVWWMSGEQNEKEI